MIAGTVLEVPGETTFTFSVSKFFSCSHYIVEYSHSVVTPRGKYCCFLLWYCLYAALNKVEPTGVGYEWNFMQYCARNILVTILIYTIYIVIVIIIIIMIIIIIIIIMLTLMRSDQDLNDQIQTWFSGCRG